MIIRPYFYVFFTFLFLTSCKLGTIIEEDQGFSSVPSVGVIGFIEEKAFSKSFKISGALFLSQKIKLSLLKKKMPEKIVKRLQNNIVHGKLEIMNDSLYPDIYYYSIAIADRVGLIGELNQSENRAVQKYLEVTQENVIITSVEIYFNSELNSRIDEALNVFLISNNPSSYSFELLNKDGTTETIDFSEGIVLDYDYSEFCWTEDYKGNPVVAAFRDPDESCPGKTVKNPSKLEREDLFESLR